MGANDVCGFRARTWERKKKPQAGSWGLRFICLSAWREHPEMAQDAPPA